MEVALGAVAWGRLGSVRDAADHRAGSIAQPVAASYSAVCRTPVWIDGAFAELHSNDAEASCDTAVLMLPALNWDAVHSHHSMRVIADSIARAGYPALRYQYPGTGDSCDIPSGGEALDPSVHVEHWSLWRQSVNKAVDWLRAATGAERVVIAGLRLGATLALEVSARSDIAGLILLAPVLRGHSYIRQMAIEAQIENGQVVNLENGIEFMELDFAAETVRNISSVDMRQVSLRPGIEVAIFQQSDSRLTADCAARWRASGVQVTQHPFDGLEALLLQNVDRDPPPAEPSAVIGWLSRVLPGKRLPRPLTPRLDGLQSTPTYRERALRYGPGGHMSGVLCEPLTATRGPLVIILNTGRDPRYGVARFGVDFARYLARAGLASFRFDFSGLGDSIGTRGAEDTLSSLFDTDRSNDISAAADELQSHGYHRFALHGLCSGAYHALRGCLVDSRIDTLLLVNFPAFDSKKVYRGSPTTYYLSRMGLNKTWTRFVPGRNRSWALGRLVLLSLLRGHQALDYRAKYPRPCAASPTRR